MADVNHVVLVGRLTRDAELKYTGTGSAVSKFGLAINRRRKQGEQWVDEANFFDIVVWGKTAESLTKYLTKGKQIAVDGELRQSRWEQDGQQRSRVEVHANNIQLLGAPGGGGSQGAPGRSGPGQTSSEGADDAPESSGEFVDDIPF